MVRLRVLAPAEIQDPELRALAEEAAGDAALGLYGHCPDLFKPFWQFLGRAKYGGRLPFALKELVRLRIADLNGCER
jgi:alkylhydroperoxidase family enzyme